MFHRNPPVKQLILKVEDLVDETDKGGQADVDGQQASLVEVGFLWHQRQDQEMD